MAERKPYIVTEWEMATYDVWGNAKDGYEVNNVFRSSSPCELLLEVTTYNQGKEGEFIAASPTDRQLRKLFGVRCQIETDGDDLNIYVHRARDMYPLGEIRCVSHASLSPIRELSETSATVAR